MLLTGCTHWDNPNEELDKENKQVTEQEPKESANKEDEISTESDDEKPTEPTLENKEENDAVIPNEESAKEKESEQTKIEEKIAKITRLVQPSIVYGTMKWDTGEFKKGERVEIIRDEGNGARYHIKADGKEGWVRGGSISIPEDFETIQNCMLDNDMEFFVNEMNDFDSKSNYLIWIDLSRQLVNIFEGEKGSWNHIHSFLCATGKNVTPTIRGTFEVSGRGERFGGYGGAKNWVRFYGPYLMHSVLVDSSGNKVIDDTLGVRASHGCVRMSMEDSKWVYDHIPDGTTVWVN